jgi:hypothetical protein
MLSQRAQVGVGARIAGRLWANADRPRAARHAEADGTRRGTPAPRTADPPLHEPGRPRGRASGETPSPAADAPRLARGRWARHHPLTPLPTRARMPRRERRRWHRGRLAPAGGSTPARHRSAVSASSSIACTCEKTRLAAAHRHETGAVRLRDRQRDPFDGHELVSLVCDTEGLHRVLRVVVVTRGRSTRSPRTSSGCGHAASGASDRWRDANSDSGSRRSSASRAASHSAGARVLLRCAGAGERAGGPAAVMARR